jgi:hypothetical protein
MKAAGLGLAFVAYTIGTWGFILVKGYNITLRQWVTPLHPFTGPLASAGTVPQGNLFPGKPSTAAAKGGASPVQKQQKQNLKTAPNPHGTVQ